jgi:hypothetical protein
MAKAFLESIEHALLRAVPIVVDWAGVLYEYLSIAMADMYSTGSWRASSREGQVGGLNRRGQNG